MQSLTAEQLTGNWATILLPIREDESIDFDRLGQQLDTLVEFRVSGIYCNGTAGEFYNQTEAEFDRISQLLAVKCEKTNMPFQIGVSHMSPLVSLHRLLRTRTLEPGAFQVILPDWYPTSPAERVAFMRRLADAADGIGLVLYNSGHSKVTLSPQEIAALVKEVPEVIGVKGAWNKELKALCPDLAVFVPGHHLATGVLEGASGAYSNVACLNPGAAQRWYELMLTDISSALEWEVRIRKFMADCIAPLITEQGFSDQAADKFMACVGGWAELDTRLRWPYYSIPNEEVERVRSIAKERLPEFFTAL